MGRCVSDYIQHLLDSVRKDERDKIFSAQKNLLQDRKNWDSVDIFNIDDFHQSTIIEMKNKEKDKDV